LLKGAPPLADAICPVFWSRHHRTNFGGKGGIVSDRRMPHERFQSRPSMNSAQHLSQMG
jgi:hypothetical protein